jgi:hypothetical protein
MRRTRVTWGIAILDIIAVLAARLVDPSGDVVAIVVFTLGVGSFAAVGALLDSRVPGNVIGLLLLAAGTAMSAALAMVTYGSLAASQVPPWPGSGTAQLVGGTLFVYPFMIALIAVPLVFPDGHLASGRFRWVVRLTIANMVAWTLGQVSGALLAVGPGVEMPGRNAFDLLNGAIQAFFFVTAIVCFGAGALAIWLRYRRGDPVQRQQIKWLVAVVGLGAVVLPPSFIVPANANPELATVLNTVNILTLFALPIVIGIAVLRYRLYEIDRIISRTIGWAVTTAVIVAVFAGIVIGLQGILAQVSGAGTNTLAVAGSTLVAAAIFQPLRRRVQRTADRRFNRARYDAQRTVDGFAERLRNEVDLGTLRSTLAATVDDAVRPVTATVWLRNVEKTLKVPIS